MLDIFFICFAFGCFSGILAGLFGVGGGLVLVPFFLIIFESQGIPQIYLMLIAIATSLATIIVTSVVATRAHHQLHAVIWQNVFNLSYGLVLGGMMGASIANMISSDYLRFIFALYMFYVAVHMARKKTLKTQSQPISAKILKVAGVIIGFVSSILGIGGGTLTVPFLVRREMKMGHAVAISSACGFPIAVMGSVTYIFLGWGKAGLPDGTLGYIYLPAFAGIVISSVFFAPIGAKLANHLPTQQLKYYFSILLLIVSMKLFWEFFN